MTFWGYAIVAAVQKRNENVLLRRMIPTIMFYTQAPKKGAEFVQEDLFTTVLVLPQF